MLYTNSWLGYAYVEGLRIVVDLSKMQASKGFVKIYFVCSLHNTETLKKYLKLRLKQ